MQGGSFPPRETDEADGENKAAPGLLLSLIQDIRPQIFPKSKNLP